jgi:hypothetical protein
MKWAPNHRYLAVQKAVKDNVEPTHPMERELYQLSLGNGASAAVAKANDIYTHAYKREVMESFLLVGASADEIEITVKIAQNVTAAYAHLFFDPDVFEDELDRIEYAYTYTRTEFGTELKKMGVDLGKECLKIRLARGASAVSPSSKMVQSEIRATAYMLAARAKTNPINSDIAKEARSWAQLALKASENNEDEVVAAGVEEITMALDAKDETTNEEKSGLKIEDIIH